MTDESPKCKICFSEISEEDLLFPCKCTGSMKYVHPECLDKWLNNKRKECELCQYKYKFKNVYRDDMPDRLTVIDVIRIVGKLGFDGLNILFNVIFSFFMKIGIVYFASYFYSALFKENSLLGDTFLNGAIVSLLAYLFHLLWHLIKNKINLLSRSTRTIQNEYELNFSATLFESELSVRVNINAGGDEGSNGDSVFSDAEENYPDLGEPISINTPVEDTLAYRNSSSDENTSIFSFNIGLIKSLRLHCRIVYYLGLILTFFRVLFILPSIVNNEFGGLKNFPTTSIGIFISLVLLLALLRNTSHFFILKVISFLYYETVLNTILVGSIVRYFIPIFESGLNYSIFNITPDNLITFLVGFIGVYLTSAPIFILKSIYRPGALYQVTSSNNPEFLSTLIKHSFPRLLISHLKVSLFYFSAAAFSLYLHSPLIPFKIESLRKVIFYFFVIFLFMRSDSLNAFFMQKLKSFLFRLCKLFGVLDFFFGIKDRMDTLRWYPNMEKKYSVEELMFYQKRKQTEDNIEKYYTKRKRQSKFALFNSPPYFSIRVISIHLILLVLLHLGIQIFLRTGIKVSDTVMKMAGNTIVTDYERGFIYLRGSDSINCSNSIGGDGENTDASATTGATINTSSVECNINSSTNTNSVECNIISSTNTNNLNNEDIDPANTNTTITDSIIAPVHALPQNKTNIAHSEVDLTAPIFNIDTIYTVTILAQFYFLQGIVSLRNNSISAIFSNLTRGAILYLFRLLFWPILSTILISHTFLSSPSVMIISITEIFSITILVVHLLAELMLSNTNINSITHFIRRLFLITVINVMFAWFSFGYHIVLLTRIIKMSGKMWIMFSIGIFLLPILIYFIVRGVIRAMKFVKNFKEEVFLVRKEAMNCVD